MATIRSTFDLNSRPASSALRNLRSEADETGSAMERVGGALDSVGTTRQREQVRQYELGLQLLGGDFERSAVKATALERSDLDSLAAQVAEIDALNSRVADLGTAPSSFSIDSRGMPESLAEIQTLKRRLDALGRTRATPSVGLGGTTPPLPFDGGGTTTRGGGMNVPLGGYLPLPTIAAGLGAAPPVLGAGTALLGSAGSAALGAGAISVAGYGTLAVGVGSIAAVAVPAVAGLRTSYQALTRYNAAVAQNGQNSTEADSALAGLKAALEVAPAGTRRVLNREQTLTSRFRSATRPAQGSFMGALSNLLGAGNELEPEIAGVANPLLGSLQRQSGRFGNFLTGRTTGGFLGAAGASAIETAPDAETAAQSVLATLMNISRVSMPFLKTAVAWLDHWTAGWRASTTNIDGTRRTIGGMVRELKSWLRLGAAAFDLVRDLLRDSAGSGGSLVARFTEQERRWDAWVRQNPEKMRAFFGEAAGDVRKIAAAMAEIGGVLFRLGRLASPLLSGAADFVNTLDRLGLLAPAALPFLRAGAGGIAHVLESRLLGASPISVVAPGGAETPVLLGGFGERVERPSLATRTRGFFSDLRDASRVPVVGGTLAAEADAGMIGATRFSATAAARAGGDALLSGAAGFGGGALRFVADDYLPLAAVMAGLTALSFPGTFKGRVEAAVSNLTLGIAPMPKTSAEKLDNANRHAEMVSAYYGSRYGSGVGGLRQQILATRRKRHRLLQPVAEAGGFQLSFTSPSSFGDFLSHGFDMKTRAPGVTDESREESEALGEQLDALRQMRREGEAQKRGRRVERGGVLGDQYRQSFEIRYRHEGGAAALGDVVGPVLGLIQHLGPAGGKALAANVLGWVRAAKQRNPKLKGQYEELVEEITASFAGMGHRIKIITGQIYEGSAKEWATVQKRMVDPIEQAREEMREGFTAIQEEAQHVLRAMGYSPTEAKRIVVSEEQGKPTKALSAEDVSRRHHGEAAVTANNAARLPRGARGMRIPGAGPTSPAAPSPAGVPRLGSLLRAPGAARIPRAVAALSGGTSPLPSVAALPTARRRADHPAAPLAIPPISAPPSPRPAFVGGVEPSRARTVAETTARAIGGATSPIPSPSSAAGASRAALLRRFGAALGARLVESGGVAAAAGPSPAASFRVNAPSRQEVRIEPHRQRQLPDVPPPGRGDDDERPLEIAIPGDIIIGSDDDIRRFAERAGKTVEAAIRGGDPAAPPD